MLSFIQMPRTALPQPCSQPEESSDRGWCLKSWTLELALLGEGREESYGTNLRVPAPSPARGDLQRAAHLTEHNCFLKTV